MHDIKWIRKNPEAFDSGLKRRGLEAQSAKILELDKERRGDVTALQALQEKSNAIAKKIGELKQKRENADELIAESKTIKAELAALKEAQSGGDDVSSGPLFDLLSTLPNMLLPDVPDGADENANVEVRKVGTIPSFSFQPKDHVDIGENLGLMDFEQTVKISGPRFATLKGQLAWLERALSTFMLDVHTQEFGYTEVAPPLLVKSDAMFGTGQLPKFSADLFETTDGKWLIPTAEVTVTNLVRETLLKKEELPLRFTACTPCFRSEAGAAGKDTRGLIRQHQFSKVELVSIVTPEESEAEHQRMLGAAEEILKRLKLPYRVMLLCSGDTGFSSRKTFDIEVWLPSQNTYREISSCSQFGDFQARRMQARYRADESTNAYVHTLNGSGLAVGRTLVAILENYQNADGSVTIPEVLRGYMGLLSHIKAAK